MHLFVCFDIADDKRRPKVTRLLNAHGSGIQKSVFELRARNAECVLLQRAISAILKAPDRMQKTWVVEWQIELDKCFVSGTIE